MSTDEDRDLREAFAALRSEEQAQATAIHGVLGRAKIGRARRSRKALATRVAIGAALVVLVATIAQVLRPSRPVAPPEVGRAASLTAWTAPTAFLLRTPGYELLSSLPALGPQGQPPAAQAPTKPQERTSMP